MWARNVSVGRAWLAGLKVMPDGLPGMLDNFLRPAPDISQAARREIADLIVRSLIPLA